MLIHSGVKAACRAFVSGYYGREGDIISRIEQGVMSRTAISVQAIKGKCDLFAFSDVLPTIGMFNGFKQSIHLFDVRREKQTAMLRTQHRTLSVNPLFVDGMPQLLTMSRKTLGILV